MINCAPKKAQHARLLSQCRSAKNISEGKSAERMERRGKGEAKPGSASETQPIRPLVSSPDPPCRFYGLAVRSTSIFGLWLGSKG
jgi:hypothetical protein